MKSSFREASVAAKAQTRHPTPPHPHPLPEYKNRELLFNQPVWQWYVLGRRQQVDGICSVVKCGNASVKIFGKYLYKPSSNVWTNDARTLC